MGSSCCAAPLSEPRVDGTAVPRAGGIAVAPAFRRPRGRSLAWPRAARPESGRAARGAPGEHDGARAAFLSRPFGVSTIDACRARDEMEVFRRRRPARDCDEDPFETAALAAACADVPSSSAMSQFPGTAIRRAPASLAVRAAQLKFKPPHPRKLLEPASLRRVREHVVWALRGLDPAAPPGLATPSLESLAESCSDGDSAAALAAAGLLSRALEAAARTLEAQGRKGVGRAGRDGVASSEALLPALGAAARLASAAAASESGRALPFQLARLCAAIWSGMDALSGRGTPQGRESANQGSNHKAHRSRRPGAAAHAGSLTADDDEGGGEDDLENDGEGDDECDGAEDAIGADDRGVVRFFASGDAAWEKIVGAVADWLEAANDSGASASALQALRRHAACAELIRSCAREEERGNTPTKRALSRDTSPMKRTLSTHGAEEPEAGSAGRRLDLALRALAAYSRAGGTDDVIDADDASMTTMTPNARRRFSVASCVPPSSDRLPSSFLSWCCTRLDDPGISIESRNSSTTPPSSVRSLVSVLLDATGDGPRARRSWTRAPALPAIVGGALERALRASVDPTAPAQKRLEATDVAVPLAALAANLARHLPAAHAALAGGGQGNEARSGKGGAATIRCQRERGARNVCNNCKGRSPGGGGGGGENEVAFERTIEKREKRSLALVETAVQLLAIVHGWETQRTQHAGRIWREKRDQDEKEEDNLATGPADTYTSDLTALPSHPLPVAFVAHVAASPLPTYLSVLLALLVVDAPDRRAAVSRHVSARIAFQALADGVQACARAHGGPGMLRAETERLLSLAIRVGRLATTAPATTRVEELP